MILSSMKKNILTPLFGFSLLFTTINGCNDLDLVPLNSINESMGKDAAELHIIFKDKIIHIPKKNKNELAFDILVNIHKLEAKRRNIHEHID